MASTSQQRIARRPCNERPYVAIRNPTHVMFFLQFLSVSIAAVAVTPAGALKLAIAAALIVLFSYWVLLIWRAFIGSSYVKMFPWRDTDLRSAAAAALFMICLPYMLPLCAIAGAFAFSWWGLFIVPAAALPVQRFIANQFAVLAAGSHTSSDVGHSNG
ncbi:ABC transporter permease [Paenibacillus sp. MSJ-34]|uniref:ABC transporter permease n=1 Tax=Paenibacillus sp. MSJ-34 TaxID=2841529 RepID=UPI00345FEB80